MSSKNRPIALTLGDAAGIGPEIIVKLHMSSLPAPCVVYGDTGALRRAAAMLNANTEIVEISDIAQFEASDTRTNRIFVKPTRPALPSDLSLGQVNALAGRCAYDALCMAIDDAMKATVRGIVTAPLNKEAMHEAGISFPGHTEILAQRSRAEHVSMMLVNDHLRVILVTIHEALADVPKLITQTLEIKTIAQAHAACQQLGIAAPRIAVAGLNPHASENGKFGNEDLTVIRPAIAQAKALGINVTGPWPGDTIFMRARRGEFDVVVAQYHDQGLIPIKYLGIDEGINTTIGLPFVRTSVDHGTAFDIAGKGIANPSSLKAAFTLACDMSNK